VRAVSRKNHPAGHPARVLTADHDRLEGELADHADSGRYFRDGGEYRRDRLFHFGFPEKVQSEPDVCRDVITGDSRLRAQSAFQFPSPITAAVARGKNGVMVLEYSARKPNTTILQYVLF